MVMSRVKQQGQNNQPFVYWLLFVYFFLEYGRPQDYVQAFGLIKPGLIVTLILLFAWLSKGDKSSLWQPPINYVILFICAAGFSTLYAVNNYHAFRATQLLFLYLAGAILPGIMLINTYPRLQSLIKFWMLLHVFVAIMALQNGGRGPGSFLEDENDLALTLNMVVPYLWFMSQSPDTKGIKRFYYFLAACVVIAGVVVTASRGGFLGLVAVIGGIIVFSPKRLRNFAVVTLVCVVGYLMIPESYKKEVASISDTENGTRNDRIYSWKMGWRMFLANPVVGVGANNYPWNVHIYEMQAFGDGTGEIKMHGGRAAHSVYFTLLPELGMVGTLIYLLLLFKSFKELARLAKIDKDLERNSAELINLSLMARAMMVAMATFLVTGTFISVLYYPQLWYLAGFIAILSNVAKKVHVEKALVLQGR